MVRAVKIECGISFRLRDNKAASSTPITCFVEFNGKPVVKIPTGTRIHPSKWNAEKERPVGGMKGLDSAEASAITEKLSTVRNIVDITYREHVNLYKTYPNKEAFKLHVRRGSYATARGKTRPVLTDVFWTSDRTVKRRKEAHHKRPEERAYLSGKYHKVL